MPFLTAIVNGQTPKIDTIHAIMEVQTDMSETLYTAGDSFEAS